MHRAPCSRFPVAAHPEGHGGVVNSDDPLVRDRHPVRILTLWALRVLRRIYRPGFGYHKAGITLLDIVPLSNQQFSLFVPDGVESCRNDDLMATLDAVNQRYGRGAMRLAAEGVAKSWQMRRGNLSPRYTTEWEGLASVAAVQVISC